MDSARSGFFGISHARLTAYLAVLALCSVVAWNISTKPAVVATNEPSAQMTERTDDSALAALAASAQQEVVPEGITPLGASILAQAVVAYDKATQMASSSDAGVAAVQSFGANLQPHVDYRTYAASDIQTSPDTSKDRVLSYRADLRTALEPLLQNKEYELDIFAKYVDSKDPKYLSALRAASANYKLAIANTEKVVAPEDAASYQAAILTAMGGFSATLDALAENATDPFASSALLRTYIDAQDYIVAAFNSVGKYASQKIL